MRNADRPQVLALSLLTALAWLFVDLKPAKAFLGELVSGHIAVAEGTVRTDAQALAARVSPVPKDDRPGLEFPEPACCPESSAPQVAIVDFRRESVVRVAHVERRLQQVLRDSGWGGEGVRPGPQDDAELKQTASLISARRMSSPRPIITMWSGGQLPSERRHRHHGRLHLRIRS